jgi:hypothetical protein
MSNVADSFSEFEQAIKSRRAADNPENAYFGILIKVLLVRFNY